MCFETYKSIAPALASCSISDDHGLVNIAETLKKLSQRLVRRVIGQAANKYFGERCVFLIYGYHFCAFSSYRIFIIMINFGKLTQTGQINFYKLAAFFLSLSLFELEFQFSCIKYFILNQTEIEMNFKTKRLKLNC